MESLEQTVADPVASLGRILATMDIPELRRTAERLADVHNLRWLSRNIQFRNSQHPQFESACDLIAKLIKTHS
jgi:hypothetical protein